jgi:alkylhydroperoxidase family enzyme
MDSVGQWRSIPEQARGWQTCRSVQSDTFQPRHYVELFGFTGNRARKYIAEPGVRQVVILAVGAVWKSNYELYAHAAAARKAGISEDAIRILTTGGLPNELSDQEKIAQRYARQLSAEHRVDAALYSAAEHTFGQRGLVEITYLTGIYHTVCALLNAFEIPAPSSHV